MNDDTIDRGEGTSAGPEAKQAANIVPSAAGERWIVDSHTHILPPRLASKIRAVFEAADGLQGANDEVGAATSVAAPTCCSYPISIDDNGDVTAVIDEMHFANHGHFNMMYHAHDVALLRRDLAAAGICSVWVLPYAHKGNGMARKLNSDVSDLCRGPLRSSTDAVPGTTEGQVADDALVALAAMTVHPLDGPEGVRATTLHALTELGCRAAKLHCSVGAYRITDEALTPFWSLANAVRLPVVVHLGSSITGHTASRELQDVEELLTQYTRVCFVMAHSASPSTLHAIRLAQRFPNLYLDTTPVVTHCVAYPQRGHPLHHALMDLARQGRVLFGSDVPNVALPLAEQIAHIFHVFAEDAWTEPAPSPSVSLTSARHDRPWWQSFEEAQRAGPAVCEVLCRAAQRLYHQVDFDALAPNARI